MLNADVKRFLSGELLIIISAALWGAISLFTRPLNDFGFSSAEITFVRSVLSVVFVGAYLLIKDRRAFGVSLRDLPLLSFLGIGCFMAVILIYTLSIEKNGSSLAVMLEYTAPVWTIAVSALIFKEKITVFKIVALFGVLGGCAMLSFGGETTLSVQGVAIGLLSGVFLALYGIVGKLARKKYSAETITFYMFLFSSVGVLFIAPAWNIPSKIIAAPESILYFVGLSFLSTAVAYVLYSAGIKSVPAGKASMLSTVEILVAAIVGAVIFNDGIGFVGYIGMALTVSSLLFFELSEYIFGYKKEKVL